MEGRPTQDSDSRPNHDETHEGLDSAPSEGVPMPWERPQSPPPDQPRSTIISAEPLLTDRADATEPEVAWEAPPPSRPEREVPGAPGFVFAGTPRRFVAFALDNLVIGIGSAIIAVIITIAIGADISDPSSPFYGIANIVGVGLSAVYFVTYWTGAKHATSGMRALQLQVGTAFDGRPLEIGPALLRWALLGYPLNLGALVPAISGPVAVLAFVWTVVLLISTVASPTRQGLHDRVVQSVVVQPAGLGRSPLVVTCLVLLVGFVVIWAISVLMLLSAAGDQAGG